ncbi:MAG TPA: DinB family protein [Bryobacteraceae bacterium]|nr:DinB family protein [Bryobacteraceae bacterium]
MIRLLFACGFSVAVASAQGPILKSFMPRYEAAKLNFIETAELFPEKDFSYRLTPQQRTVSEWIDHTVMSLHNNCSALEGKAAPPMDHSKHSGDLSKAQLQKALKDAFDHCDSAIKGLTDEKVVQAVSVNGKESYPINSMFGILIVLNEHYGNLVGYMRTKGLVPPSTARAMKAKK